MKRKRSLCLLLAVVIATAYLVYLAVYFLGNANSDAETLAALVVLPHMVVLLIGVILGWLGYLIRITGFALASAILYCVSAAIFAVYALFLVPSIILGFIGYARQKKLNKQ